MWSLAMLTEQYAASNTNSVPLKYTCASQAIVHAPREACLDWPSSTFSLETSPVFLFSFPSCTFFSKWSKLGVDVEWPVFGIFGLLSTLGELGSKFALFFRPRFCCGCLNLVLGWASLSSSDFEFFFGVRFVTNSVVFVSVKIN